MDAQTSAPFPTSRELHDCRRKVRHESFLSALHHTRKLDDGIGIYGCDYCGGSHVGHHVQSAQTKLKRTNDRLERARQALRTNNGAMKAAKRLAYENSIRDLTRRQSELEAEAKRSAMPVLPFPPELDWWGLVSIILINFGIWLQHKGCHFAARSKRPWSALAPRGRKAASEVEPELGNRRAGARRRE